MTRRRAAPRRYAALGGLALAWLVLAGCAGGGAAPDAAPAPFTIAVIPDTQNYVDYTHQRAEGFALDAGDLFLAQMRDVAARDDVVFVASVGDVWQHPVREMDADHEARGFVAIENAFFASELAPSEKVATVEIPKAVEGYRILDEAGIPFGVAPGNHDHDAMWSVEGFPPNLRKDPRELTMTPEDLGMIHVGGLDGFLEAFGAESEFFRDRDWYVASHEGGTSSAQVFEAGGYRFLHLALAMSPSDATLAWAASVIEKHPGLPTIVSTHDFLDPKGERRANPLVDLARIDPEQHNTAEEVFTELIREHDQIFLVLCGHHHGQSRRVDANRFGHDVHQVLADYQDRGQAGVDAGQPPGRWRGMPVGIGDGWYRLMTFDLASEPPRVTVRTWSSHYQTYARDLDSYAEWYRAGEQPDLDDAAFLAEDSFEIVLDDFRDRCGPAR